MQRGDCQILVAFYTQTGGANWLNHSGWLGPQPCAWHGVSCTSDGYVSGLGLWNNHLTGSLPEAIGNLSQLRHLNVWGNSLTGAIPTSLGNLSGLISLDLDLNQLSGPIPASSV